MADSTVSVSIRKRSYDEAMLQMTAMCVDRQRRISTLEAALRELVEALIRASTASI
jgi:hypothetical protein|tara:strand:+ start:307 stop:474 length:168 start_codon:yes stop_codon:yes gene_type:complete